jgi:hypothetical protein
MGIAIAEDLYAKGADVNPCMRPVSAPVNYKGIKVTM